jgi:hypothetical protein
VNTPAAGVEVHHRAREPAGHREAAGEGGAQIARAERHEFAVRHDALSALGGQRLPDRDRFHEAHDADQQGGRGLSLPQRGIP